MALQEPAQPTSTSVSRSTIGVQALMHAGPGVRIRKHLHDTPFATFIIRGECDEVDDRERVVRAGPGSLNYCPAGTAHSHLYSPVPTITLCAMFAPWMVEMSRDGRAELQTPHIVQSAGVISVARRIETEMTVTDDASGLVLQGLFIELLGQIVRAKSDRLGMAPDWLRTACAMLREVAVADLSIQQIAREVAVHPAHLARCFRRYLGQSPGEFARQARLERAVSELSSSSKPLKQIARECGFADQAHFSRQFRQAFGYPPSAVRRKKKVEPAVPMLDLP